VSGGSRQLFLNTVESSNLDWQASLNSSTRDDCNEVKKSIADKAIYVKSQKISDN
jgi:hypothetical protein